jgi:hypothetical protein
MKFKMQTIILKDNESEFFTRIRYPDGQQTMRLDLEKLNIKEPVQIKCRIAYFYELEILGCLIASLRKNDYSIVELEFTYLFGVRSDRAFTEGEPNYFRDVLAPIINSFKIPLVSLVWPFTPLPILNGYLNKCLIETLSYIPDGICIGGDETASKATTRGLSFVKERNNGEVNILLDNDVRDRILSSDPKIITIVDDICDGGATFISASKYLKEFLPNTELKLFIYHGLFTKGIDHVARHFDEIICTNSYRDNCHPKFKQIKVI